MPTRTNGSADSALAEGVNADLEAELKELGVRYEKRRVRVDQINERESRKNQARPVAIDNETVEKYATAMRAGDVFPYLLLLPTGDKYTILAGNHRHASYKKVAVKDFGALVIDRKTPAEIIDLLVLSTNAKNALPVDAEWRSKQAVQLLKVGVPRALVLKKSGLAPITLTMAEKAATAGLRAARLDVAGFDDLSLDPQYHLGMLEEDDLFAETARLVVSFSYLGARSGTDAEEKAAKKASIAQKEVRDLVKTLKQLDPSEAFSHLGLVAEEWENRRLRGRIRPTKAGELQNFVSGAGKLCSVDTNKLIAAARTPEDKASIRQWIDKVVQKAVEIEEGVLAHHG